jgi:hypothetical protein
MNHYFVEVPTYPRHLFLPVISDAQRIICENSLSLRRPIVIFLVAEGMLAVFSILAYTKRYRSHADDCIWHSRRNTDKYLHIGEDTTLECVRKLAKVIIRLFGSTYIWAPNEEDTERLMSMNERRGWPGNAW